MSDSDSDFYDPGEVHPTTASTTDKRTDTSADNLAVPPTSIPVAASAAAAPAPAASSSPLVHGVHRLRGVAGRVRSLCLNPAGSVLCAGGEGGTLCMWDFAVPLESPSIRPTRVLTPFPNRISGFQAIVSVHAACDGSYFVACQDGDAPVLVGPGGRQLGYCAMGERGVMDVVQCKGHRAPVTSSAASPAAARFLTASQDGTARLWDVASAERQSVFAVAHGSGHLMDTVAVQSVAPIVSLAHSRAAAASVFATGGEDGVVQLWDARQRFRPGGALAACDVYASASGPRGAAGAFAEARHVGGMAEPDPTRPLLCVRRGSELRAVDLRRPSASPFPPLTGLSCAGDTAPLVACAAGGRAAVATCTARGGHRHCAGGHVVLLACGAAEGFEEILAWRPAADDVLAVAVRAGGGEIFAGMQSGDVVGRTRRVGATAGPSLRAWMEARPAGAGRKRERNGKEMGEVKHGEEEEEEELDF